MLFPLKFIRTASREARWHIGIHFFQIHPLGFTLITSNDNCSTSACQGRCDLVSCWRLRWLWRQSWPRRERGWQRMRPRPGWGNWNWTAALPLFMATICKTRISWKLLTKIQLVNFNEEVNRPQPSLNFHHPRRSLQDSRLRMWSWLKRLGNRADADVGVQITIDSHPGVVGHQGKHDSAWKAPKITRYSVTSWAQKRSRAGDKDRFTCGKTNWF